MRIKLITLQPKDISASQLKKTAKELFKSTNDPSFNIIEPLIILGQTKLTSFANIKINAINQSLIFNSKSSTDNQVCFVDHKENKEIESMKNILCEKRNISFTYKYFKLPKENSCYPIIRLGNGCSKTVEIPKVIIDDFRIEIIEIQVKDNIFYYNTIDSIHLSKDKVL